MDENNVEVNIKQLELKDSTINTISPLVLAYLGDTVYEKYIREYLIKTNPNRKVNAYHKSAIKYVRAEAQADIIHKIEDTLSEEEFAVYRRGRNQKSNTSAKNANIIDYKHATGFEALIGYLYLKEDTKRLEEIINKGIEIINKQLGKK